MIIRRLTILLFDKFNIRVDIDVIVRYVPIKMFSNNVGNWKSLKMYSDERLTKDNRMKVDITKENMELNEIIK